MGITNLGDTLRAIARGHSFAFARGLLVVGSLTCTGCTGGCGGSCPDPILLTRDLSDEERAALGDATRHDEACQNICRAGNLEGMIGDAGASDAGPVYDQYYGPTWSCQEDFPNVRCTGLPICVGGRAPQSLEQRTTRRRFRPSVGDHFASMAHLESAAVPAFFELACEMDLHGAPRSMSRAARHSARQEVAHARLVGRLARRFGGDVPIVERGEIAPRSLFEMARDNAFEGCVREAYGALLAAHQAAHAADPEVRSTFSRIARDEAQHALLSLALHDWARSRVTDAERRVLDETREEGITSLIETASLEEPDSSLAIAGLPSATGADDLARALAS